MILAAASHDTHGLTITVLLLGAGVLAIAVCHRLGLNPIVGFFAGGAILGPQVLDLVHAGPELDLLAEIGVAFLLFEIGLHLSFKQVWESRRDLLALAPAQILGSALLFAVAARAFGMDWLPASIIGGGLALSSTAVVAQLLSERGQEDSPLGRSTMAILIGQDIFVVFLLVLMPVFAENLDAIPRAIAVTFGDVALAFGGVFLIGRFLLQPVFGAISRSGRDDLFTMAALLFVLAVSWGVGQFGLSLPLGAFLAGMALSESKYAHLVRGEINPFRTLLLSLFFVSVGIKLDLRQFLSAPHWIALITLSLVIGKITVLWLAGRLTGGCNGFGIRLGFTLGQGSEFGLALFPAAAALGLLPPEVNALLLPAIVLTLILTPFLFGLGEKISRRWESQACPADPPKADSAEFGGKVVIVGFDPPGERLALLLDAVAVEYIAYEMRRDVVAEARARGFEVSYASPSRPRITRHTLRGDARAVVVLISDSDIFRTVLHILQRVSPDVPIFAAHPDYETYDRTMDLEVRELVILNRAGEIELQRSLLTFLGVGKGTIKALIEPEAMSPAKNDSPPRRADAP